MTMLSDAELRELEIQILRIEIEKHEKELIEHVALKDGLRGSLVLTILGFQKEKLEKLELESADELDMIRKMKDGG